MTATDIALIADELGPLIKAYVEQVTAPLIALNKALELRLLELETKPAPALPERGERGDMGQKGDTGIGVASLMLNADARLVAHFSDGHVQDMGPAPKGLTGERGAMGPAGKDGQDGLNGKDGAMGPAGKDAPPVDADAIVAAVLARLPAPVKGDRGEAGPAGLDGKDGAQGLTGVDGAAGLNGKDGAAGLNGKDGAPGLNGKDGVGVMDAVQDRAGHLVLTLSDGRTKDVGLVAGRDGVDGIHGKDGIGVAGAPGRDGHDVDMNAVKALVLSELTTWPRPKDGAPGRDGTWDAVKVEFDGERTIRLQFKDGTPVEGGTIVLPTILDRGVFEPGKAYQRADAVTYDGHSWIAQADTNETPGDGAKSWRLSVRRGKQGKEGKPGKDAPVPRTTNTPPLYG